MQILSLNILVRDVMNAPLQEATICWYGRIRKRASSMSYELDDDIPENVNELVAVESRDTCDDAFPATAN